MVISALIMGLKIQEQNFEDGVLEPQAVTYGQRVEQAAA